jgi:hypothetical protein
MGRCESARNRIRRRGGKWKAESNTKMRLKRTKIIKRKTVYATVTST